ncbi:MAG: DoxX family protein [Elainella sp.]
MPPTASSSNRPPSNRKEILRAVLAIAIIIVGITHFTHAEQYLRIVPTQLPHPLALVYISGVFEILGGIGLTIPWVSVAAAWGLIALFIAVFPANINQAIHSIPIDGIPHYPLLYWFRLPFQAVLIAWAWWYTRHPERQRGAAALRPQVKPALAAPQEPINPT